MKFFLSRFLPMMVLAGLLSVSAQAQTKIATIDLRKVFDGYWKTKQADGSLKEHAADMERVHKTMLEDFKKGREDYTQLVNSAADQAVSADERDRRKRSAEEKLKGLREQEDAIGQYERTARQTLDEKRRRMRDEILGEIRNIVNAKAKTGNYSMVIDVAAESFNNTPVILFNTNENSITDDVLKELNTTAPADGGKSAAPADTKVQTPSSDVKKK